MVHQDEMAPLLPTVVRNHFSRLAVLSALGSEVPAWRRAAAALLRARGRCADEGSRLAVQEPSGKYAIAPVVEGRIVCVGVGVGQPGADAS